MKIITVFMWVVALLSGPVLAANAQKPAGNLEVSALVSETTGTYGERKLCRQFLEQYMKDCPYVRDFSVTEMPGSVDNHAVVWHYRVDNWNQITQFYGWLATRLKSSKDEGIKTALSPYGPDYKLGGRISVAKWNRSMLAKH
jgi:hypothetical protein